MVLIDCKICFLLKTNNVEPPQNTVINIRNVLLPVNLHLEDKYENSPSQCFFLCLNLCLFVSVQSGAALWVNIGIGNSGCYDNGALGGKC